MFSSKVKVYFFDADPAGIIFYASLFKFAHSAYEEFLKSLKTDSNYFFDENYVLPIIHAEGDYKKPIKVGDELTINVSVAQVRDSSFELNYNFIIDDQIMATAKTVHISVNKKTFAKTSLPDELREKLKANLK